MTFRFHFLIAVFLLAGISLFGQTKNSNKKVIKRQLVSAQTGLPLSYVNIIVPGSKNTFLSDIAGYFSFTSDLEADTIIFDGMSVRKKRISFNTLFESSIIELEERSYNLGDVDVYPTSNDASHIMTRVKENIPNTNPNQVQDYSCYIYSKMVFDFDTAKLALFTNVPAVKEATNYAEQNHLLLIESLTELKHAAPNLNNERIITGRVSGFKQPSLEFIPTQLKPFSFSEKQIKLLNTEYLNPVSDMGLKLYQFKLVDTTFSVGGDTIFNIKYSPKNKITFNGLYGSFQVESKNYAIVQVEANGFINGNSNKVFMRQTFKNERDNLWFPSLIESEIQLGNVSDGKGNALPLIGVSKSYFTSFNFTPNINKEEFSRTTLTQDIYYNPLDTIQLANFRATPLTAKDSITFTKLDSLGKANNFDRMTRWGRSVAEGYIPLGILKIDYTQILDYNRSEGFTLGMGLYTSSSVSKDYTFGGYYRFGLGDKKGKWGSSLEYTFKQEYQTKVAISYSEDVFPTNGFAFIDGYPLGSSEAFGRFFRSNMKHYKRFSVEMSSRFARDFKASLFVNKLSTHSNNTASDADTSLLNNNLKTLYYYEIGTRTRWVHKEEFIQTSLGKSALPSSSPYVWLNYTYLTGKLESYQFNGHKIEAQAEMSFHTAGSMSTAVRLTSGTIIGAVPFSLYYGAFGTYSRFGVEVPYSLSTMRPNEFMSNLFVVGFLRHKIPLFGNTKQRFKPNLFLNTSVAFGSLKGHSSNSFEKGYYESGIVLDNLFKNLFFKYGFGVYYRYGPYHLSHEIENWAIKIAIGFTFK